MANEHVGITLDVLPGTLGGITAALGGFNELVAATSMLTTAIGRSTSVVDSMLLTLGVGIAGAAWEASKSYGELERAMKIVQSVSGQTSSEISVLTQKANEFSVKYKMGIDDITEGLQTLGRAGLSSVNTQIDTLQAGLRTAKVTGDDLSTTLNKIVQTTALMGGDINSSDFGKLTEKMSDMLVATSQSAPLEVSDVVQTLSYSGGTAAVGGINIQNPDKMYDYLGAIAAFGQKGVSGSMAGTALRAFFTKPASQTDTVKNALSEIGMKPEDLWEKGGNQMLSISQQIGLIQKQMEKFHLSQMDQIELWGQIVSPKMGQQMLKLNKQSITELSDKIKQTSSAEELANNAMNNYLSTIEQLSQKGQKTWRDYGNTALAVINPILQGINELYNVIGGAQINGIPIFQQFVKAGIIILISQIIQRLGNVWNLFKGIGQEIYHILQVGGQSKRTIQEQEAAEKKRLQELGLTKQQADALVNSEKGVANHLSVSNQVLAEFLVKLNQAVALMSELATLSRSASMMHISDISAAQHNRRFAGAAKGMPTTAWFDGMASNKGNLTRNEFAALSLRHGMNIFGSKDSLGLMDIYKSNDFEKFWKEQQKNSKGNFPTAISLEKYLQQQGLGLYRQESAPLIGLMSGIKADTGNIQKEILVQNNVDKAKQSANNQQATNTTNQKEKLNNNIIQSKQKEVESQTANAEKNSTKQSKTAIEESITNSKTQQAAQIQQQTKLEELKTELSQAEAEAYSLSEKSLRNYEAEAKERGVSTKTLWEEEKQANAKRISELKKLIAIEEENTIIQQQSTNTSKEIESTEAALVDISRVLIGLKEEEIALQDKIIARNKLKEKYQTDDVITCLNYNTLSKNEYHTEEQIMQVQREILRVLGLRLASLLNRQTLLTPGEKGFYSAGKSLYQLGVRQPYMPMVTATTNNLMGHNKFMSFLDTTWIPYTTKITEEYRVLIERFEEENIALQQEINERKSVEQSILKEKEAIEERIRMYKFELSLLLENQEAVLANTQIEIELKKAAMARLAVSKDLPRIDERIKKALQDKYNIIEAEYNVLIQEYNALIQQKDEYIRLSKIIPQLEAELKPIAVKYRKWHQYVLASYMLQNQIAHNEAIILDLEEEYMLLTTKINQIQGIRITKEQEEVFILEEQINLLHAEKDKLIAELNIQQKIYDEMQGVVAFLGANISTLASETTIIYGLHNVSQTILGLSENIAAIESTIMLKENERNNLLDTIIVEYSDMAIETKYISLLIKDSKNAYAQYLNILQLLNRATLQNLITTTAVTSTKAMLPSPNLYNYTPPAYNNPFIYYPNDMLRSYPLKALPTSYNLPVAMGNAYPPNMPYTNPINQPLMLPLISGIQRLKGADADSLLAGIMAGSNHSFKQVPGLVPVTDATGEARSYFTGNVPGTKVPYPNKDVLMLEQTAKTFQTGNWQLRQQLRNFPNLFSSSYNASLMGRTNYVEGASTRSNWFWNSGMMSMVNREAITNATANMGKLGKVAGVAGGALGSLGMMFGPLEMGMMGISLVMQGIQSAQQRYKEELEKINSDLSKAREEMEAAEESYMNAYEEKNPNATQEQKDEALLNVYNNGEGDRDDGLDSYRQKLYGTLSQIEINTRKKSDKENDFFWGSQGGMQKHLWSPWDETWGETLDNQNDAIKNELNDALLKSYQSARELGYHNYADANPQDFSDIRNTLISLIPGTNKDNYHIVNSADDYANFANEYLGISKLDKTLNHYPNWVEDLEDYSEDAKYAASIIDQGIDFTGPLGGQSAWARTFGSDDKGMPGFQGISDYKAFEKSLNKLTSTERTRITNSISEDPDFYKRMERLTFGYKNRKLQRTDHEEKAILNAIRRRVGGISEEQARQTLVLSSLSSINQLVANSIQPTIEQNLDTAMSMATTADMTNAAVGWTGNVTSGVHQGVLAIAAQLGTIIQQRAMETTMNLAEESGIAYEDLRNLAAGKTTGLSRDYGDNLERAQKEAKELWELQWISPYTSGLMTVGADMESASKYAKETLYKNLTENPNASITSMYATQNKWFVGTMAPYIEEQWIKSLQEQEGQATGGSGSGKDKDKDKNKNTSNRKNWVNLAICNKKEIPKLNVNLFKKPPNFTILNRNLKLRDFNINTADDAKSIQNAVKNTLIEVQNRSSPKIIQDEEAEYDPIGSTDGKNIPTGETKTK